MLKLLSHLKGTRLLTLTLCADKINTASWWVDAAFGVHQDMKSHTGGVLKIGDGAVQTISTKQKINTKSSTEAELVGADDASSQMSWTKYFLEEQGYKMDKTILFQDNKSAILLEKNGKESSTKRTKHINIRCHFLTDRIKNGDFEVEHYPTDDMIADFFTKPLMGAKFKKFRKMILNLE